MPLPQQGKIAAVAKNEGVSMAERVNHHSSFDFSSIPSHGEAVPLSGPAASGPVVVALDFETADNRADSACALGMVRVVGNSVTDTLYTLIRPPRSRVYFTQIHGLTWSMLKDSPTFGELWPEFAAFLAGADYFVAHNASFDRSILYGCCRATGVEPPSAPFLCTVKGSRKGFNLPHNRLCDVCDHLGIELDHHNAASDALAAARIYLHLRSLGLGPEAMLIKGRGALPQAPAGE